MIAAFFAAALVLQDDTIAVRAGRVIPIEGDEIENAVILIRNGRIDAIGADVEVPDGARVIDASGLVVMPGFVNPYSRAGLVWEGGGGDEEGVGGGNEGDSAENRADRLAKDLFRPTAEALDRLARAGYTTAGLYLTGGAFSGRMIVVRTGGPFTERVLVEQGPLRMAAAANTESKRGLREAFDAAREQLKKEQEAAEPAPAEGEQAAPAEGEESPPAEEEAAAEEEEEVDPKLKLLVQVLKGEVTAILEARRAATLLHGLEAIGERPAEMKLVVVGGPEFWRVPERVTGLTVIVPPEITFRPYTRDRVSAARELHDAGVTFAIMPSNDGPAGHETVPFHLALMARAGIPRDAVLGAVTRVPAEILGVADKVGTLAVGKEANLVFLTGDPLEPPARIVRVMVRGETVYEEAP